MTKINLSQGVKKSKNSKKEDLKESSKETLNN